MRVQTYGMFRGVMYVLIYVLIAVALFLYSIISSSR